MVMARSAGWMSLDHVALATSFLGLLILWVAYRSRRRIGLPIGRIGYADRTGRGRRPAQTLVDRRLGLAGRPDFLLRHRGRTIPVEIKSASAPPAPHASHVMQLAGYCRLVETEYGHRPPHGIIQYRDGAFQVDYTRALEARLIKQLAQVRDSMNAAEQPRSHRHAGRCAACSHRSHCDQAIE